MVVRGGGLRAAQVRYTAIGEPLAVCPAQRRPVPRAALFGTVRRDRAVSGHDERGPVASVVGHRAFSERDAHHLAGAHHPAVDLLQRRRRLRDHVRTAHRAAGQERRSHGAVRPTSLGSRFNQTIHVRQTFLIGYNIICQYYFIVSSRCISICSYICYRKC